MYLDADYIHPTPHKGSCRVRIYRPDLPVEGSAAADEDLGHRGGAKRRVGAPRGGPVGAPTP
jgi:hypothetical protein